MLPETPAQLSARKKLEAADEQRIVSLEAEQKKRADEKAALDSANTQRRDELDDLLKKLAGDLNHAEFFKDKTPRAFAMSDGPSPADMPIYVRGNPYAPAAIVPRGTLRVASWDTFPAIPAGQSGRLQLADWLADKRNPLTARVVVNRLWQKLFGTGLVPSVDYFGTRGDAPTHPELLDHLATRFMQGGWSQKAFLRSLVLSGLARITDKPLIELLLRAAPTLRDLALAECAQLPLARAVAWAYRPSRGCRTLTTRSRRDARRRKRQCQPNTRVMLNVVPAPSIRPRACWQCLSR